MNQNIFVCGCERGGKVSRETVTALKNKLEERNTGYTYIEDMCGCIPKNPQDLVDIKNSDRSVIIGCQPRAMQCLLDYAIFCTCGTEMEYYNADKLLEDENLLSKLETGKDSITTVEYKEDWKPWYPVIDYNRCTSCMKCMNFCLFGVYDKDPDGKVLVTNPSNCKDLCPACARACPEQAIIFPKHHESIINGENDVVVVADGDSILDKIQNEDVYQVLSQRRKSFSASLLKTEQLKIAEEERRSCCADTDDPDCCSDDSSAKKDNKSECCGDTGENKDSSCC